jgi:hypothetical protein
MTEVGVDRSDVFRRLEQQINDPKVLGELHGVQENALLVGKAIESIDLTLPKKKGWVEMFDALFPRMRDEMAAINGKVDSGDMLADEAKIRNDQMQRVVYLLESAKRDTELDIDKLIARREGLVSAEDIAAQQFDLIQARWERAKRISAEDAAFKGRPDPLAAVAQETDQQLEAQPPMESSSKGNGEAKPASKRKTTKRRAKRKPAAKKG